MVRLTLWSKPQMDATPFGSLSPDCQHHSGFVAEEAFPHSLTVALAAARHPSPVFSSLPFVDVERLAISSPSGSQVLENVFCLWDTAAQTTMIISDNLDPSVRNNEVEGHAVMDIKFRGMNRSFDSTIHFRPTLPNGVDFVILGQEGLIDRLEYVIKPALTLGPNWQAQNPGAYGQIDLISWLGRIPL